MVKLIISTLAEYQTRFWIEVGRELARQGREAMFLSFDSRSNEMLRGAGLAFVDATASAQAAVLRDRNPLAICRQFGVNNPSIWLTHEKFAFGVADSDRLLRKLAGAMLLAHDAIDSVAQRGPCAVVQELGGFLSVLGTHFAAKSCGAPSWFIEPSFFRGRLLFNEGSLAATKLPGGAAAVPTAEMRRYLEETTANNQIVIPQKDRHQYTSAFRKVVNRRNARRLAEKLRDKHLLGKEQEFGHIGSHVTAHARMIVASRQLARHYTSPGEVGRFLYYPLHVPGDVALTLRSPEYLNQSALIDYLCRVAPLDLKIAVKEHPAMIGAMGARDLLDLKRRYDRFVILPPQTNNYDVLRRADAVVTVNSKSGAEAGLLGRRVLVLGDAFYRDAPFARPVAGLADLATAIEEVSRADTAPPAPDAVERYFAALWERTGPGELYVEDPRNVSAFTASLLEAAMPVHDMPTRAAAE